MEHTANIIKPNKGIISSLLMVFAMFELLLIDDRYKVEAIATRCINCKKETGLYLETSTLDEIITEFVLNTIWHHVGMSWIICSNEGIKYEIDKSNHQDWLNKGPLYNTDICSRLHGSLFEYFITYEITDRYNLLCYLVAYDKKQPAYEYEESIIGDKLIPKVMTTES